MHKLARELNLKGWIVNNMQGVAIEIEGEPQAVAQFLSRLRESTPPRAHILSIETLELAPVGYADFQIRQSNDAGSPAAGILPDIAVCQDCLRELFDPPDRRFRYPFINCTNCGPRYSIINSLPYDRPATTMRAFQMCAACRDEYENPDDRRFHAQPIACRVCGPRLQLWDSRGWTIAEEEEALRKATQALREGKIIAVKGLGGFHLLTPAGDDEAIRRLRQRKRRGAKPFAVMFPDLTAVRRTCSPSPVEQRLLTSPEAPIVLIERTSSAEVSLEAAPDNPHLGALLPYTPLHHLILRDFDSPIIATSGNLSEEPICIDEREALTRIKGIADLFLVHNRPIARHVDDSVVRVLMGREQVLRRARGFAPMSFSSEPEEPVAALGGHLKNAAAIGTRCGVVVSQHIGDLEARTALETHDQAVADLINLYDIKPSAVLCDLNPDYYSTFRAEAWNIPLLRVQHHLAHILACAMENSLDSPYLGVAWDGAGYGADGTIQGGEFFLVAERSARRIASLLPLPLIGGDAAAREPKRSALGVVWASFCSTAIQSTPLEQALKPRELALMTAMLQRGVSIFKASSAGRLFDAVSSLLGLCQINRFEGEAAMALEFAAAKNTPDSAYPMIWIKVKPSDISQETLIKGERGLESFTLNAPGPDRILDWRPAIRAIMADIGKGNHPAKSPSVSILRWWRRLRMFRLS